MKCTVFLSILRKCTVFLSSLSPLLCCSFLHLCRSGGYIAFCVSGYRSAIATSLLRKAGFRVRDIFGGFAAINFTAPSYTTSGAVSPPTDTLYYMCTWMISYTVEPQIMDTPPESGYGKLTTVCPLPSSYLSIHFYSIHFPLYIKALC